jgi:hypothetical protein
MEYSGTKEIRPLFHADGALSDPLRPIPNSFSNPEEILICVRNSISERKEHNGRYLTKDRRQNLPFLPFG